MAQWEWQLAHTEHTQIYTDTHTARSNLIPVCTHRTHCDTHTHTASDYIFGACDF
jgi:hypothetical protein